MLNTAPQIAAANDGVPYELGMKFQVNQPGYIDAISMADSTRFAGVSNDCHDTLVMFSGAGMGSTYKCRPNGPL